MNRVSSAVCLAVIVTCLGACNNSSTNSTAPSPATTDSGSTSSPLKPRTDQEAIEQAIQQHLRDNKGINLSAMDVTISNIRINSDQAQADTEFRLKQGGTSMSITYFLERHADGWLVVRNQPSNAGQFAHPPMDKVHSGAASTGTPGFPDVTDFMNRKAAEKPAANGPARQQ